MVIAPPFSTPGQKKLFRQRRSSLCAKPQVLAKNICAQIEGRPLKPFHFNSLGSLCVVGHQTACAEITVPFAPDHAMQFSGLFAWAMWRGIYLAKLPGIEQKIRVLIDWTVELFFPPDIVQTIDLSSEQ